METDRIERLLATRHPRERAYEGVPPALFGAQVLRPQVRMRAGPAVGRRFFVLAPMGVVVIAIAAVGLPLILGPSPSPAATSAAPAVSASDTASPTTSPIGSAGPTSTSVSRRGTFRLGPSMTTHRVGATAIRLEDGRVLFAGGFDPGAGMISPAEVFDPSGDRFAAVGNVLIPRYGAGAALLLDGRVLVVGGFDQAGVPLADAELFDPRTDTFTRTGSLHTARGLPAAVTLPSGKVLVVAGSAGSDHLTSLAEAELYDPSSGTFAMTGSMAEARQNACVVALANGDVLVAGGYGKDAFTSLLSGGGSAKGLSSAELYQSADGTFHQLGSMAAARAGGVCALLADGRVLIAGGQSVGGPVGSSELFVPATRSFVRTGDVTAWSGQQAVRLADGRVLVTFTGQLTDATQLYDPATGKFTTGPIMLEQQAGPSMTLLDDGRVLLAGGMDPGFDPGRSPATQIYTP